MVNTKCLFWKHKWVYHYHPKYITSDYKECSRCGKKVYWINCDGGKF